jgi:hypothetical protein
MVIGFLANLASVFFGKILGIGFTATLGLITVLAFTGIFAEGLGVSVL